MMVIFEPVEEIRSCLKRCLSYTSIENEALKVNNGHLQNNLKRQMSYTVIHVCHNNMIF